MEGLVPSILDGNYATRYNAVEKCYRAAVSRKYKVFALQRNGYCSSSPDAESTYKKHGYPEEGDTPACDSNGKGGKLANEVYQIAGTY